VNDLSEPLSYDKLRKRMLVGRLTARLVWLKSRVCHLPRLNSPRQRQRNLPLLPPDTVVSQRLIRRLRRRPRRTLLLSKLKNNDFLVNMSNSSVRRSRWSKCHTRSLEIYSLTII
jgi:hypothetical protein